MKQPQPPTLPAEEPLPSSPATGDGAGAPSTLPRADRDPFLRAAGPDELAELLTRERQRIQEENEARPAGRTTCRALSERTDWAIHRLFTLALPEGPERERVVPQIAIAATGGYGRRELSPYSDVDVTFIVAEEEDEMLDRTVRQMFLWLMQVFAQRLQLKVGYGYRTLADLGQTDHQSQTALLDARLIAGSHGLFDRFTTELIRQLWPAAFVRRKVAERAAIREKHHGTVYRVEPNVREGCGGLRDLHVAEWLAAIAFPTTRGDVWRQLERLSVVSRRDAAQVQAAREFLLVLRNLMHFSARRPADALVRERQEELAASLGYRDDEAAAGVQHLMADYYEHAGNVARVAGFVEERVLAERLSLTDELAVVGGDLAPAYPWVNVYSASFLVEICEQFQEHGLGPGPELRRTISEQVAGCGTLSDDREAAQRFVGLLRARTGIYDCLQLMASLGILQRWLPHLGAAFHRVPFEVVHENTIGYHSLQVARCLERLRDGDDERLEEFRRIWAEVEAPELLFLAALLHDVGKLSGSRGHAETGARLAAGICQHLGLDEPDTGRVEDLIRHHLLMSETAQLLDLTQEQTIRDFAEVVQSVDLLNMLVLLTYADLEATGVLTSMKARFLQDLYYRAEAALMHGFPEGGDEERLRKYRSRLSRQLSAANLTPEQIQAHCEGMPVSYLLNTPSEQIATHIRMIAALREAGRPVIEYHDDLGADITTMTICTFDAPEPGLLSRVAGVLYAHEVAVHGAQVYTRVPSAGPGESAAIALDTLWIDFHGRQLPPFKKLELETALAAVLGGERVDEQLKRHRKHLPPALPPNEVRFDNEVAEHHTVLRVDVPDQPGLLYRLTRAIASLQWHIHSAKISTTGERARDAFYLTDRAGHRIHHHPRLEEQFLAAYMRD